MTCQKLDVLSQLSDHYQRSVGNPLCEQSVLSTGFKDLMNIRITINMSLHHSSDGHMKYVLLLPGSSSRPPLTPILTTLQNTLNGPKKMNDEPNNSVTESKPQSQRATVPTVNVDDEPTMVIRSEKDTTLHDTAVMKLVQSQETTPSSNAG